MPHESQTAACIAVVDDDDSVRKALRRMLATAGYAVETFPSAAEYVARRSPTPIDCLVLDIRMPAVTGLDLQRYLTRISPAPPIVMITGHGSAAVRERALADGAVAVLDKPFSDDALLAAIDRALASR
jgi:two-component system response regulator FixJ